MTGSKRYQVKTGEKYMNVQQLRYFEEKLRLQRKELLIQIYNIRKALQTTSLNLPDNFDTAQSIAGIGYDVKDLERRHLRIQLIDQALLRMDSGEYGFCVVSGDRIGLKRLEIEPTASMCVEVQEALERSQRNKTGKQPPRNECFMQYVV